VRQRRMAQRTIRVPAGSPKSGRPQVLHRMRGRCANTSISPCEEGRYIASPTPRAPLEEKFLWDWSIPWGGAGMVYSRCCRERLKNIWPQFEMDVNSMTRREMLRRLQEAPGMFGLMACMTCTLPISRGMIMLKRVSGCTTSLPGCRESWGRRKPGLAVARAENRLF
jgi:hypothetical protein